MLKCTFADMISIKELYEIYKSHPVICTDSRNITPGCLFFALKGGGSAFNMYLLCMGLGFGSGISVLYITMSAEQFGTNLRSTAAVSIPNLVRGFLPIMLALFRLLRSPEWLNNYITGAWVTGIIVMTVGFVSVLYTRESFGKDLDFIEK